MFSAGSASSMLEDHWTNATTEFVFQLGSHVGLPQEPIHQNIDDAKPRRPHRQSSAHWLQPECLLMQSHRVGPWFWVIHLTEIHRFRTQSSEKSLVVRTLLTSSHKWTTASAGTESSSLVGNNCVPSSLMGVASFSPKESRCPFERSKYRLFVLGVVWAMLVRISQLRQNARFATGIFTAWSIVEWSTLPSSLLCLEALLRQRKNHARFRSSASIHGHCKFEIMEYIPSHRMSYEKNHDLARGPRSLGSVFSFLSFERDRSWIVYIYFLRVSARFAEWKPARRQLHCSYQILKCVVYPIQAPIL